MYSGESYKEHSMVCIDMIKKRHQECNETAIKAKKAKIETHYKKMKECMERAEKIDHQKLDQAGAVYRSDLLAMEKKEEEIFQSITSQTEKIEHLKKMSLLDLLEKKADIEEVLNNCRFSQGGPIPGPFLPPEVNSEPLKVQAFPSITRIFISETARFPDRIKDILMPLKAEFEKMTGNKAIPLPFIESFRKRTLGSPSRLRQPTHTRSILQLTRQRRTDKDVTSFE